MAQNPSTPSYIIDSLAQDAEWFVRAAVAANGKASEDVLTVIAEDDDHPNVLANMARNPTVDQSIILMALERLI